MASRSRKNQARGKTHSRQTHTLDVFFQLNNKLVKREKQKKGKKTVIGLYSYTELGNSLFASQIKKNWLSYLLHLLMCKHAMDKERHEKRK